MSRDTLLRPGIAAGPYPQKEEQQTGTLDNIAASLAGRVRQLLPARAFDQRFVARVNELSEQFDAMESLAVRSRIATLRSDLFARGLEEDLIVRAFAMVRWVASQRLGHRPYDVQILAGRVMLGGSIAEMETGEGKTLTATLPACAAALAGIPVHIVTVNDFLVKRDAEWMRPIYESFGLSVGMILEGMSLTERREAYACDVTYCTNKQLVFDYLKDQIHLGQDRHQLQLDLESLYKRQTRRSKTMMRGLCFAIVDEADSVLIDEARTPLIISSKGNNTQEELVYREALSIAAGLSEPRDFVVKKREKRVVLTDFGRASARRQCRAFSNVWRRRATRETLVEQALLALHAYQRDHDYLVVGGEVKIIDEYTGRVMPDRSWERGLHQMIETREQLDLTSRHETMARISYQRFFRRYLRLAGMTGTAREVTGELWSVYQTRVERIPTNRPLQRQTEPAQLFASADEKWKAVIKRVRELHKQGRPVLIGTRSVAASKLVSMRLRSALLPHEVLNATQNQAEASIVATAGRKGKITVATNMAGRGTDIKLEGGVAELGGLHVLATERHDARRIDRQLFGRCGRQGDPGSYQVMLSLEDELISQAFGRRLDRIASTFFSHRDQLPRWFAAPVVWWAQRSAERHHRMLRGDLLRLDEKLGDMLAFAGARE